VQTLKSSLAFRIRHPSLPARAIVDRLRLEPSVHWNAGEPRKTPSGRVLGGVNKTTYVCFIVHVPDDSPEEVIRRHLAKLHKHQRFFASVVRAGGTVEYYLTCRSSGAVGVVFKPEFLLELARMHIQLGIDGFESIESIKRNASALSTRRGSTS
jgi:hypothetical protein